LKDNIERIKIELAHILDAERIKHSISTAETAKCLSKRFGVDVYKAEIAGLLHDCAKCYPISDMRKVIDKYDIRLDEIEKRASGLWHAPVGVWIAKEKFDINDDEILQAIRVHPTGDKNMSILDKVILVADYIEINRDLPMIEDIRQVVVNNLNLAVLMTITAKLQYLLAQNMLIHPRSVIARNSLLLEEGE
jgi:predicted HD superfamily hydrolase involved in NAD metabolism